VYVYYVIICHHTESIQRVSHVYVYPIRTCIESSYREYPMCMCIYVPCMFVLCDSIQRVSHGYMYPMCYMYLMCICIVSSYTESIQRVSHAYVCPKCMCIPCAFVLRVIIQRVSHVYVYPMCFWIVSIYVIILRVYREYPMCMCITCVFVLCVLIQRVSHVYLYRVSVHI